MSTQPTLSDDVVAKFAQITVTTGDLDPMYDLIWRGSQKYGNQWASQYALHFFMFYDAGQAASIADASTGDYFWSSVIRGYDEFKRGTERRHFRGEKGRTAVQILQKMGSPYNIWRTMWRPNYLQMLDNINTNFKGCQIGPYFAWKAMDLLDRCLRMSVFLTSGIAAKHMPEEPKKCALTIWPHLTVEQSLLKVVDMIGHLKAPGSDDRKCGLSEAETVLCMIKGYFLTKTHKIGDDVDDKHAQLISGGRPNLCNLLPIKQDWSSYEQAMAATTVSA